MDMTGTPPAVQTEEPLPCPVFVGYACDVPTELREQVLGDRKCSACDGCLPRQQCPETLTDTLNTKFAEKYELRRVYAFC